jgi:mannitol-specific phosphotransferase system IIBC component
MSPSDYPQSDPGSPIGRPVAQPAGRLPISAKAAIGVLAALLVAVVTFAIVLNSKLSSAHRDSANLSKSLSQARADTASREKELAAAKNDLAAAKTDAQKQARASQQLITALKSCATGMYQGWLEISNGGDTDMAVRYFLQAEPICEQVVAGSSSGTGSSTASLNSSSRELNQ